MHILWPDDEIIALALHSDGSIACCRRSRPYEISIGREEELGALKISVEWAHILAWSVDRRLLAAAGRLVFLEDGDMIPVKVPPCITIARSFVVDVSRENDLVGLIGGGACVFQGNSVIWMQEGHFVAATLSASKQTIFCAEEACVMRYNLFQQDSVCTCVHGQPEALALVFPDVFVAVRIAENESHVLCFSWDLELLRDVCLPYVTPTWNAKNGAHDTILEFCGYQDRLLLTSSRGVRSVAVTDATSSVLHVWNQCISKCAMLPTGESVYTEVAATGVQRWCLKESVIESAEDSVISDFDNSEGNVVATVMTQRIPADSALGRAMRPVDVQKATTNKASKSKVSNQPTTFHRKVKSSGYLPKAKSRLGKTRSAMPSSTKLTTYCSSPPLHDDASMSLPSAATDVLYNPSGSHLLCVTTDNTVWSYRLPATKNPSIGMLHKAPITSICASVTEAHCTGGGGGPLCLTTADASCHLWALSGPHAGQELVTFDKLLSSRREGETTPIEAVAATFLCLDTVVLIAMPSQLGIYRYQLHTQNLTDDIKRLQKYGAYKCTGLLQNDGAPMASVCANNNMTSGLVIANSQREIMVWDLAVEKKLAQAENFARLTSVQLSCPLGSGSPHSCDLFYTASTDNCVRIWDLRSMQVACEFSGGHKQCSHRLSPKWSPCMSYMAVPSETGEVFLYDARTTTTIGSMRAHRDVASSVDFNPLSGTLVSAGFDCALHFYRAGKASKVGKPSGGTLERHWRRPGGNLREQQEHAPLPDAKIREPYFDAKIPERENAQWVNEAA